MKECKWQLSDSKVYSPLPKEEVVPLLIRIKVTLQKSIERFDILLSNQDKKVHLQNIETFTIPYFYILPKFVQNRIVGRPIVAGRNWITRPASKYKAFHLQKYYKLFDTIITDDLDLLRFIETVELPAGCELSTIDAVSLYTNISLDHFMEVIRKLFKDHPILESELLLHVYFFFLCNNLLQLDGTTFIQIFEKETKSW